MADLHLHRVLRAPRSAVWACWTDPAHIPHWFAPKPVVTRVLALDLRPGGAFHVAMSMDGTDFPHEAGCFLEVAPEERLTWTSALGPDFRPIDATAAPFVFTATLTFADHPEGTDYRVLARHKDRASADAHEAMGFSDGWGTVAEQLGAYAAAVGREGGEASRRLTLSRSFRATPAEVYAAWTDPAVLPLWFGPEGYACETHAMDLREGGEWRFTMRGEGMTFLNRHRWTRLLPPGDGEGRIEFLMDGIDGQEPKSVVVTLAPEGTGTRLTQVMTFASAEDVALARSYDAEAKGQQTLAKLAARVGG